MKYNSKKHHRRSIRLKEYDYSQPGLYYITICTYNRELLFGNIFNNKIFLNNAGIMVKKFWCEIPLHFPITKLDEYIIMPNHIHGIIKIIENDDKTVGGQNFDPLLHPPKNQFQKIIPRSIGSIIRGFKTGVTKWFRNNTEIHPIWQRNYYEHIIRNEDDLDRIRQYIIDNPLK